MAIKAVLESLDGLSDQTVKLSDLYVERDGKFLADVEAVGGIALEDVQGLKDALGRERENVAKFERKLGAFKDLDPAKAREALEKVGQMADWTPEDKVREQIAAREKQLLEKHAKELGDRDGSIKHLTAQIEKHLVEAAATAALGKHKGNVELLLPHVKAHTRVEKDADGNFVARVVGPDGNVRVTMKQGSTDPMGIDEFVASMRENPTYAPAFEGTGQSGSGASGQAGTPGSAGTHRISAEDARDMRKLEAAKARAKEAGARLLVQSPWGDYETS